MIEALVQQPFAELLGRVLVHSLWQGLILALLFLLATRLIPAGQHGARHAAATVFLLVWLLVPVLTWNQLAPSPVATSSRDAAGSIVATAPESRTDIGLTDTGVQFAESAAAPVAAAVPASRTSVIRLEALLPYAAFMWLIAASVLVLRFLGGYALVQQLRRTGRPIPELDVVLRRISVRMGLLRRVRLAVSDRVDSPSAMGLLRPVVLLPASVITGLGTSQLELVLAHELAHLRRNDYLVSLLQGLAEALLFYHPLTWWLSRTLNAEREHACDELALAVTGAQRLELAETLAQLAGTKVAMRPALSAANNLTQRIARLLRSPGAAVGIRPALMPLAVVALASLWFALADQVKVAEPEDTAAGIFENLSFQQNEVAFFRSLAAGETLPVVELPEQGWWPTFTFVDDLQQVAPYELYLPSWLPDDFYFSNAVWQEQASAASVTYSVAVPSWAAESPEWVIGFSQRPATAFAAVPVGAEALVEQLSVAGTPAAFVAGSWASDSADEPVWQEELGGILAWEVNGMTFVLSTRTMIPVTARRLLMLSASSLISLGQAALVPRDPVVLPEQGVQQWVSVYGDVELARGSADIWGVSGEGSLTVEERSSDESRRMTIVVGSDSGAEWIYAVDGVLTKVDKAASVWFDSIMSDAVLVAMQSRSESLRSAASAVQDSGTRVSIIFVAAGTNYVQPVPGPGAPLWDVAWPSPANVERLTQAYAHGLISPGLFELNLRYFVDRSLPNSVSELDFAIEHLDSEALKTELRNTARR